VLSQIYNASGDWVLDLSGQTYRRVCLASVPSLFGYYNARVLSRCFDSEGNITGFLQIGEGSTNTRCSLRIGFTSGKQYALVMSPLYAGTGWAKVTCTSTDGGDCDSWRVEPAAWARITTLSG
jgi:hypothetical protein